MIKKEVTASSKLTLSTPLRRLLVRKKKSPQPCASTSIRIFL